MGGLKVRGLGDRVPVVSDPAPRRIRAIDEVFAGSLRQRCPVHKKRNMLAKEPESERAEVGTFLTAVYNAPTLEVARTVAEQFAAKCQGALPSAVRVFLDDLEACLVHLRCPEIHRKVIRTTNVVGRVFEELRRRSKVIPHFFDEHSCLKPTFA